MPTAAWGIEVCFQAKPAGITRAYIKDKNDEDFGGIGSQFIKFDVTRQVFAEDENHRWDIRHGKVYTPVDERANDDMLDYCDDVTTTDHDFLYAIDAPGPFPTSSLFLAEDKMIAKCNFYEFVRVSFDGARPTRNGIKGSRCSPKHKWRTCLNLVANINEPNGVLPNGDEIFYAMKNPDPNVAFALQLFSGKSGEPNDDQAQRWRNNTIRAGDWLQFQDIEAVEP